MSDIREWLARLGLERYADAFEREEVGLDTLSDLSDDDLRNLGLPLGPRKTVTRAIGELRHRSTIAQLASPDSYTPPHLAEKILSSRTALEGERKQVTVLFCDIADSTGLAAHVGPEAMHGILNRFFHIVMEEVHRYEGTVNQFLGDGLMALFGAPLAHEDHARRAVLAALGIRRAMASQQTQLGLPLGSRLSVRIGLHTGPVVVGSIGDNLRMDYTAIGDTTNLAARLQQAAHPEQILISEATARIVVGYVSMQWMPPLVLKGRKESVNAAEVTATGHRRSRLEQERALSPFVGRDREIDVLRQALEEAIAGRGQVVGIMGEPGVGKSRVLHEFRLMLRERNVAYFEGWCQSFGQSIPYLPLQDLLRAVAAVANSDTPAQIADRLDTCLTRLSMSWDEDTPYLLRLLGLDERGDGLTGFTPEAIQAHTLDVLTRLILAVARDRPLVVGIEDLHWVDKSSESFLTHLVEVLPASPILLFTTARPGYSAPWVTKSYATQLALRALSAEASRLIVEATSQRSGVADKKENAILSRAEGNPLFLEELTLALEADPGAMTAPLPETIQGVLSARIDRLPEQSKRSLQTASVLGREFPLRLLREIAPDKDLDRQLSVLKRQEFLFERASNEGPILTFKHALTQEVAYDSLLSGRKQVLHEAAGRALEKFYIDRLDQQCEVLAHHFSRSAAKEKALDYLELANQKAANANAVADARAYFEAVIRLLDTLPDEIQHRRRRVTLVVRQAHVFVLTNGFYEYQRHLDACLPIAEQLGDNGLLGHLYACLGHLQFMLGRAKDAAATLRAAAELCEGAGNFRGAAHAYAHLQWAQLQRGEYEDVLRLEVSSLHALAQAPEMRLLVYALTASAWACAMLGRWKLGVEKGNTSLQESERARDLSLVSFSYTFGLTIVYLHQGAIKQAIDTAQLAVKSAQTPAERQWAESFYGWALASRDAETAIDLVTPIVAFYRSQGLDWAVCFASVPLGEACLRAGRLQKARECLEHTLELGGRLDIRLCATPAQRLLGEVMLAEGSVEALVQAKNHFEAAMVSFERSNAKNELALTWMGYGRLQARLGRSGQAREYLSKALEIFDYLGTLVHTARLQEELAALSE